MIKNTSIIASGSGGLIDPIDLGFNDDGNLYVLNIRGVVKRYAPSNGAFIDTFITSQFSGGAEEQDDRTLVVIRHHAAALS